MTLDLSKIKSDAEIIASRCDMLLMTLPVRDVLEMVAEIENLSPPDGQVSYQQQMEAWKSASSQDLRARGELMIQVEELEAENEALRKDAERYRWMRDHGCPSMESWFYELRSGEITKDQADSEIDEAMTKERP